MGFPRVSIIVLNWNGLTDTIECLESLHGITYPNYNVILVDNASQGDDVKVLREKFGDHIHIIQNDKNYGFAKGNNIGIRFAMEKGAGYVLLLNNDTSVTPEFLDEMVKVGESDEKIGILCPKIYLYYHPEQVQLDGEVKVSLWWGTITSRLRQSDTRPVVETGFATGAAMMIRRQTMEQIGLLPEEYFFGVEDVDYSLLALKNNFKIVVARRAVVLHKGSRTAAASMDLSVTAYHVLKGWQILRRKYLSTPGYLLSSLTVLARQAFTALAILLRGIWHRDLRQVTMLLRNMAADLKVMTKSLFSSESGRRP